MKKIVLIGSFFLSTFGLLMIVLIACLMIFDSGDNVSTDDYVENNSKYASKYISTLNKFVKKGKGYVPLNRIVYFYNANKELTFDEIYEDNLDIELKQMKPISEVCSLEKYKGLDICRSERIQNSKQIDYIQSKPFVPPLKVTSMNVTSFFKEQRVVYGNYSVHKAWDFSSPAKTTVYSSCDGKVISAAFFFTFNRAGSSGGGGNQIKVRCNKVDDEVYTISYMHLYPNSAKVKTGDDVVMNQPIAEVGTTGYSTGNHLHFQVNNSDNNVVDGMSLINFN